MSPVMRNIRLNYTRSHRRTSCIHDTFQQFCKNKIDDGWLAEREDPKKLKELSIYIATIVNGCYNKSWYLYQNGRRKCKQHLRELFPDTKVGCKTDCEVSPTTFFCYTWCQYNNHSKEG